MGGGLLSTATVTTVGLICKAVFKVGFCSVTVNGLPNLMRALEDDRRNSGRGVVTVSNHISILDDPVTWGVLPTRYFLSSRTTRWALGASDIMFTNPVFSIFFRLGQTLETFRGKGIYQPAVDVAIKKLNQGDWVHLYGEGKVNQPSTYPKNEVGIAHLPRFKWGVGRILMESAVPPVIVPMWLTGFDKLMPEGRAFPYKYFPRPGAQLNVTFGDPLPVDEIKKALGVLGTDKQSGSSAPESGQQTMPGWMGDEVDAKLDGINLAELQKGKIRSEVTAIIQRGVESLGRSVSGEALTQKA